MLLSWAAWGAIIGLTFGLAPLLVGLYRHRPKSALISFIACVAAGAAFGLYGALPVGLGLATHIWRGKPIRGASGEIPQ